jgi:CheY-like chemotaxis protein
MPVMDGRKSAETIRQYEGTLGPQDVRGKTISGRIPILAVSATLLESERTQMATYFDGWVLKPIDFKRMLRLLSGITKPELRKEDAYVRGEWERGGWLNGKFPLSVNHVEFELILQPIRL